MPDIQETPLPGVGVRLDFTCQAGDRIGVITRHSGRRDVVVYHRVDHDAVAVSVELTPEESQVFAELLGGTRVTEQLNNVIREVEGLALDWLVLPAAFSRRTIGETQMRTATGVSVIAIVRGDHPIPAPGPDDRLEPGDTVVVTGTAQGLAAAAKLLGV